MNKKKRSQSIRDKNASRNYNNNSNNNNNRNTDSSDGKRHSSLVNLSPIQKSLSSTITKKLEEKTISEVFWFPKT